MSTSKIAASGETIKARLPSSQNPTQTPTSPTPLIFTSTKSIISTTSNTSMLSKSSSSSSLSSILIPNQITKQNKNQKIHTQHKNTYNTNKQPLQSSTKLSPIIIQTEYHSPSPIQDTRRWCNLGGNVLQRIRDPPQSPQWKPQVVLPKADSADPFGQLLQQFDLEVIKLYCQGPSTTILRLFRKTDIHITNKDIRDIISHNSPIYHESLVLGLELLCATYNSSYVDPSFIPTLKTLGWSAVAPRFSPTNLRHRIDRPSYAHPSIAIPIHIGGFHWAALCRRIINGITYFFYADDLNSRTIEHELKRLIMKCTNPDLCPANSQWINCSTPIFRPHSNECGPRTMLALAVMVTHPAPHHNMLQPYMSTNLAQHSRHWMSFTLLTGIIMLLPPSPTNDMDQPPPAIVSSPHTLIQWDIDSASRDLPQQSNHRSTQHSSSPSLGNDKSPSTRSKNIKTNDQSHRPYSLHSTLPKIIGAQTTLPKRAAHNKTKQPQRKLLQPPSQLTLFDTRIFTPITEPTAPDFWGHHPDQIDINSTFRIFFNNPSGLKLTSDQLSVQYSLSMLNTLGTGAVCLAETNLNWKHPRVHNQLKESLKKTWRHSASVTSHITEDIMGENQPGSTLTIVTNNWTSRIIERGSDPYGLGRWTYITLRGKNGLKILLVTAYRVCTQALSSIGPHTSTAQQHHLLAKSYREANEIDNPIPRLQFIVDLQAWLEHKVQNNYSIILSIDANEGTSNKIGKFLPKSFTLDHPIPTTGHDGSIATLLTTCGLCDPLCLQHTSSPPPATYRRGKERIDYIFISINLMPAVIRTGIFPYDHIFISDHRPTFIDFNSILLFQEETSSITPQVYRGLQTLDPRLTSEYANIVTKQIQYHKLDTRIQKLYTSATDGTWTADHIQEYESIDTLLTESMLSAEKQVSKKVSTTYAWSPQLKRSIATLRYWQLSLKKATGKPIPDSILIRYQQEAEIDIKTLPDPLRLPDIITQLRQARTTLHNYQKRHLELRTNHLQELADARLISRNPNVFNTDSKKLEKQRKKELHRIIRRESNKQLHRKIGYLLKPEKFSGGLNSVDIPAGSDQPFPSGPDPKLWEGTWHVITDPDKITTHVAASNSRQYNQATNTPFGQEPLQSLYGYKGDTPAAEALISGQLPPKQVMEQLLPETQALLRYLTIAAATTPNPIQPNITCNQFTSLYTAMAEGTSSSPSGRHIGHYKVATKVEALSQVHSTMMTIPYLAGFSPTRWRETIDVMLLKTPGDRRIHRLRIVALQESDFNQSNRLLIGRPLLHQLEDNKDLPDIQYGSRPSKQCHSAILNKVLTYEIHRYQKKPLAYIENDAAGCYDRIINPLILIFLRILGLSKSLVACLAATWEQSHHRIKTLYGISATGYRNSKECPLFGPGQGSTIGPLLWLLCFLLIFRSLSTTHHGIVLNTANNSNQCQFIGEAFVDDAGLGSNTSPEEEYNLHPTDLSKVLITRLQHLAQEWERLLFSTGGALNLQKCFWFIMSWQWVNGKARLYTHLTLPGELKMTSGNNPSLITIPRIEPTQAFRTLGLYLTPSGCNKGALIKLQEIVITYATAIIGARINRQQALVSYVQYLLPRLRYQPPLLSLSQRALEQLHSTVLSSLLPKLHVNRHTARSIIHGPQDYGGMRLPHPTTLQGIDKLQLFLGHLRLQDRTGALLQSDLSYLQLLTGSSSLCLNLPKQDYEWVEQGWLTSLWQFTNQANIHFSYPDHWIPPLTRQHDCAIMEKFIQMRLPTSTLTRINRCRLYLQVITLSDIVSADGTIVLPAAKQGNFIEERPSNISWPKQGYPTKADWSEWRKAISLLETNGKLSVPLGAWTAPSHQTWQYFQHPPTKVVYLLNPGFIPRQYHPIIRETPRTRSHYTPWYDFHRSTTTHTLPHPLHPATLHHDSSLTGSLFQVNVSSTSIPTQAKPTPPIPFSIDNLGLDQPPPYSDILQAMQTNTLTIICSSHFDRQTNLATSTCTFLHTTTIYEYESPATSATTSLRAELFSILVGILILRRAESLQTVPSEPTTVTVQSNSKQALRQAFQRAPLGPRDAVRANYDIIMEIHHHHPLLATSITSLHGPVTNGGVTRPQQNGHPMIAYSKGPGPTYTIHLAPNSHVITVFHRGAPLFASLQETVINELHRRPLQLKLQKDNNWTDTHFCNVDWEAFNTAIGQLPRAHRISISKLSHQLWNTNEQNRKYYGQSELFPYCRTHAETLPHIYTCQHSAAATNRATALEQFKASIRPITPNNLFDCILSGMTQWTAHPTMPTFKAPTEGSILPQLASLTVAFRQQCELGWAALLRGHIAVEWRTAFYKNYEPKQTKKPPAPDTIKRLSKQWSVKVIRNLWTYSKAIWTSRNEVVHGLTNLAPSKEVLLKQEEVRRHYRNYAKDPHYVPNHQTHLFHRPLPQTLALRRDTMTCWLKSVEEAILTRNHRQQHLTTTLQHYFRPRRDNSLKKSTLWTPPFTKQYYAKHPPTFPALRRRHTTRAAPTYRHPVTYRCQPEPAPRPPQRSESVRNSEIKLTPTGSRRTIRTTSTIRLKTSGRISTRHRLLAQRHRHHPPTPQRQPPPVTLIHFGFRPPSRQGNIISLAIT